MLSGIISQDGAAENEIALNPALTRLPKPARVRPEPFKARVALTGLF